MIHSGDWKSRWKVRIKGSWNKPLSLNIFRAIFKAMKGNFCHLLTSHRLIHEFNFNKKNTYLRFGFDLIVGFKLYFQTYSYVLLGVLSVVAAFTSTALLFEKYIPQLKQLADLGNTTAYKELQKARDE